MVHKSQTGLVNSELFTPEFIRAYICVAKSFSPTISVNLQKMLIDKYIMKRQDQVDLVKEGDSYTTTRTLLATIRLCQARVYLYLCRPN
jgi:DNA replicative helicase MCM subunit Mcm2 (Cdc46/Mcm family)